MLPVFSLVTESKFSEQIVRFQSLFWNERLVFSPRKKMHWVPQLVFFPSIFFVSRLSFVGKQEIFFGHVHFSRIFRAVERSKIWTTPYFRLEKETFAHTGFQRNNGRALAAGGLRGPVRPHWTRGGLCGASCVPLWRVEWRLLGRLACLQPQ